jgi:hypothetical protein
MLMLAKTPYTVSIDDMPLLEKGKHDLTVPSGDFFYDPWVLLEEYKNTVWESILDSLPIDTGQARIIVMESPSCYTQHADIDDRYHLNLSGDQDYLIDLDNRQMHKLVKDGVWYEMDAGRLHTAISVGEHIRMQLVVRKLLTRNVLNNPVSVKITAGGSNPRYRFDNTMSVWLNRASKNKTISNFKQSEASVYFDVEHSSLEDLKSIVPKEFKLESNI